MDLLGADGGGLVVAERAKYSGGDNSVLKMILYTLWNSRCYWCHRPMDFNDAEIDHILPKDAGAKRLMELKVEYGLPKDFDIDDPQNLAPICSPCNGRRGKGKKVYGPVPVVLSNLDRARELRPKVVRQVSEFGNSKRVAEHLLRASVADLSDPKARRAFEEHAPVVVQKLALVNKEKADFVTFRTVTVLAQDDELPVEVGISLNGRGRTAAAILEDVCRCAVEDVLEDRVPELVDMVCGDVRTAFEDIEGPAGPTSSGPPVRYFTRVDVDSIGYERVGALVEFTFGGNFEASFSASLVQDSWDGSGLTDIQGDAEVSGIFSFVATWDFSTGPGAVDAGDCYIESWAADVYTVL
ncbi:HNH endonuclease [Streptomyces sp. S1D4-11]|nr:HNH endonuclease [Streptomyces sp. S1D4-11]QIY98256.1 HNH endonuclease [Streptomyces sp. S1D4-11]